MKVIRHKFLVTWILIFAVFMQSFVPALANQPLSNQSFQAYQAAYQDYVNAVQSNASVDEITQKHEVYLRAQEAYKGSAGESDQAQGLNDATASVSVDSQSADAIASQPAAVTAEELKEAEAATQKWQHWREFQQKIVAGTLKMLGGTNKPGDMPIWERIAWTIGKSLIPTMGVIVATALLAPLSPVAMIIGGIITGAALAGTMTYAFEKRMNAKYRTVPKEEAKIWRDVTVQASIEAVMAPFNLATGGLFGMVGPTVGHAIGKVALTQATITFIGRAVSSSVGGGVKNLWANYYFKYPEKIEANEARIDEILDQHLASGEPFSEATIKELDTLRSEIDMMKGEQYSKEDAVKDLKRAGISAAISGFAGSIISDRTYNSGFGRWADRASLKLFGSVAKGKSIASLFSTMPVNFGSGMAGASLEKSFISSDIKDLRKVQGNYAADSAVYGYYERVIAEKEAKKSSINVTQAGFDSMMNSFAVHAARLSVDAIKYNVYDGPKARKAAIEKLYREKDPEWQKADKLQQKYEKIKDAAPNPIKYRNPAVFARAVVAHKRQLDQARNEWLEQADAAQRAEANPANVALKSEIKTTYERDAKLTQILELGRLTGGDAHLAAMKKVLQAQNPTLADASDEKLTELAAQAIKQTYVDKYTSSTQRAKAIEETLELKRKHKAGEVDLSADEAKLLTGKASVISPSQYKAALVEKYVYELKAGNTRWNDVERRMPAILARAEREMLAQYNNNWGSVLVAEAYANGLAQYKYSPEGSVNFSGEMKKIIKNIPTMLKNNILGEYTNEVNKAIISNVIPKNTAGLDGYLSKFGETAINEATGKVINTVYDASSEKLVSSFFR